jgi:sugar phosphate isomerase/epimerase
MDYKLGLIGGLGNEEDYWDNAEKIAALGYGAVEGGPFLGGSDDEVKAGAERLAELGLECCSVSVSSYELDEKLDDAIETARAAGARHVSMWYGPAEDEDQLKRDAERYNEAGEKVSAAGLKLCYHNHDHEFFRLMHRTPAIQVLLEETDEDKVFFEPDLGWIAAAGCDPVRFLLENAGRVPVAHLRDLAGPGAPVTWTTPGTGIIDMRALITAAVATGVEYMVYEPARARNLMTMESVATCAMNLREMCLL